MHSAHLPCTSWQHQLHKEQKKEAFEGCPNPGMDSLPQDKSGTIPRKQCTEPSDCTRTASLSWFRRMGKAYRFYLFHSMAAHRTKILHSHRDRWPLDMRCSTDTSCPSPHGQGTAGPKTSPTQLCPTGTVGKLPAHSQLGTHCDPTQ